MKLTDLFGEFIPDEVNLNGAPNPNPEISSICTTLSDVTAGSLFAAIPGRKFDGHSLCQKAVEFGAVALLVEKPIKVRGAVTVTVPNVRKVLAIFAGEFYGRPADSLKLIGITGTNGKTTTSYMLGHILNTLGHKTAILGTTGYISHSGTREAVEYTTPEPLLLHKQLSLIKESGAEFGVMEVSSQALDQKRVYGIEFAACVFTNLSVDHLDYHKTMQEYRDAKFKLLSMASHRIVNADCGFFDRIVSLPGVTTFSFEKDSAFQGKNVRFSSENGSGTRFDVLYEGRTYDLEISLPGIFNAYNALSAFSTACTLGFDPYAVADALESFPGVRGRCESVPTNRDFSVIIDYAHTPDGLSNILLALRPFVKGRIICIFGCGGDRDKSKRPLMGQIASANSDYVIVTSDNPRTESRIGIVNDILSGIPPRSPVEVIPDRRAAIIKGILEAKKDDLVLIAGKGHEEYQIIGTQKIEFDERKIISEALEYKE